MKKTAYLFIAILFLSACGVKYKTIPYFVDLPTGNQAEDINNQTVLKIQKNDILAITVSSLDPKSDAYFNQGNISSIQMATSTGSAATPNGFIVDQGGNVQLPYLGSVKVEGLSTYDARKLIEEKLESGKFLMKPVLNIRLVNFKISILGDVVRPGVYPVQSERITIIEALGMAGDLNITAKRNDVLLIRENLGKRQQVKLNLQSKDIFNSPYYYLENNDVVVVTPSAAKYASVDSSYRNAALVISALSVIALLITRF